MFEAEQSTSISPVPVHSLPLQLKDTGSTPILHLLQLLGLQRQHLGLPILPSQLGTGLALPRGLLAAHGRPLLQSSSGSGSLFDETSAAFRAYDVAGMCRLPLVAVEHHKPANRVTQYAWPAGILFQVPSFGEDKLH